MSFSEISPAGATLEPAFFLNASTYLEAIVGVRKRGFPIAPPILVALGGNLADAAGRPPRSTLEQALARFEDEGIQVAARSRWWTTAPVPPSDQPDFVNGVVRIETDLAPEALMAALHRIEAGFGRTRPRPNAPRVLDLDLIDYRGRIARFASGLALPHPRAHLRLFVLDPIADVLPEWRHPASGLPLPALRAALPAGQRAAPLAGDPLR